MDPKATVMTKTVFLRYRINQSTIKGIIQYPSFPFSVRKSIIIPTSKQITSRTILTLSFLKHITSNHQENTVQ